MTAGGNTVLVTGGGTGIGRGLAEALHARGAKVIIAGRRESALAETAAANPGMAAVRLDVADLADISSVAAHLIERYPDLNMLVNAAGIALRDDAAGVIDDAALTSIMAINVLGPIRLTGALIEHFKTRPSAGIVYVTSTLGYLPHSGLAIYSASKAALHSYVLSQRYRLRGTPVRVIEIAPPMVATSFDGNASNSRAMTLDSYLAETMQIMDTGAEEVLVKTARQRREQLLIDELGAMNAFNDMVTAAHPSSRPLP